jgi:dTDP-glucose 4,6-dehydratase
VESLSKVLITGGLGFIGLNMRAELRNRGHDVWTCDLQHSEDRKNIRCDISKYRQVKRLFEEHHFEYVYHAAAEYGRWNGELYYENLWNTNVVGTKNMLKLQEKKNFRMIFFGSAEVYGDYDDVMVEEVMDRLPIRQMNDYALTKWVNELQILNSTSQFGTETVRIRLFNVYGPWEHYTPYRGFIPKFIYKAMHDEPYTVYRHHERTVEYIEDICRTLGQLLENFKPGQVYNLGGDEHYEIQYVSDLILQSLNKDDSKVTYKETEPFTTRIKKPDSSKAKKDLNFKLLVPIERGITQTIEWFKEAYG